MTAAVFFDFFLGDLDCQLLRLDQWIPVLGGLVPEFHILRVGALQRQVWLERGELFGTGGDKNREAGIPTSSLSSYPSNLEAWELAAR